EPPPEPGEQLQKIPEEERARISDLYASLDKIDHYRLLGVDATADARAIKNGYFARARLYHPDRFFRKDVGALRPKIDAIFGAMSAALDVLSDPQRRATYDVYLAESLKTRITRRSALAAEARKEWPAAAEIWARVVEGLPADPYVQ